ncbi:MAG: hypothetical protein KAR40_01870 [Candidatus Sabulitectum sp.]|nr:hypothetical protein [Candidatus Sabulitectum sp.]
MKVGRRDSKNVIVFQLIPGQTRFCIRFALPDLKIIMNITMNTYTRARTDQLAALVNQVATVLPQEMCTVCVHIESVPLDLKLIMNA